MRQWSHDSGEGVTRIGTVDSYIGGQVAFLTQIATTGEVGLSAPSAKRAFLIALVQALDVSKMDDALNALSLLEFEVRDLDIRMPMADPTPLALSYFDGEFTPVPFDFDDE